MKKVKEKIKQEPNSDRRSTKTAGVEKKMPMKTRMTRKQMSEINTLQFEASADEIKRAAHRQNKDDRTGQRVITRFPKVFGEFTPRWLGIQNAFDKESNVRNKSDFVFALGWQEHMWFHFPVPMEGNIFYNLAVHWDYFAKKRPEHIQRAMPSKLCSLEPAGFYSPGHFGNEDDYGIHISQGGLVHAANEIHKLCPKEPRSVVLVSACHFVYCHLVVHAWIEDICSIMDFKYGCAQDKKHRQYTRAHRGIDGPVLEEEALCDTAAFGMLHEFLGQPSEETRKSREIPVYSESNIFNAIAKWRERASGGRYKFSAVIEPPHESPEFVRGLMRLLYTTYKYERSSHYVLASVLGCNLYRDDHMLWPSDHRTVIDSHSGLINSDNYPVIVHLD